MCVGGRIRCRQWGDQNGGRRNASVIVADEVMLLGGGQRSAGSRSGGDYDRPSGNGTSEDFGGGDFGDDSIPFSYASRGIEP